MSQYLFEARHISKAYTGHKALNEVSIQVPRQSIFGLLGPNGAGKTTLIRCINQIIFPDQGQMFFDQQPLKPHHVQHIGYLPEERGLYKKMKVGEQALYLAQLKGISVPGVKKEIRQWFEKFDLMPWWDRKVEDLSKGMQQKVQFITTVLHRPRLLIFDEPFSGFDPINVNLIKQEILKLRDQGATIIFSTHNMASVEELCENIALINKSQKILEGNVQDIRKEYSTHIYEVQMGGLQQPLDSILDRQRFELIRVKATNGLTSARIKINDNTDSNLLLQQLMPLAHISSFKELVPSMNDIFIKTVTGRFPLEHHSSEGAE